jgi:hypothetical protein
MIAVGALIPRRGLLGDVHMMAEHGICENGGIGTPESIEGRECPKEARQAAMRKLRSVLLTKNGTRLCF